MRFPPMRQIQLELVIAYKHKDMFFYSSKIAAVLEYYEKSDFEIRVYKEGDHYRVHT